MVTALRTEKEPRYKMRVLVFVSNYLPGYRGGGPIRTIQNMVENLGDEIEFLIVTRDLSLIHI